LVKDEKRKLKPSELLKADKVSNPISQSYIKRTMPWSDHAMVANRGSCVGHTPSKTSGVVHPARPGDLDQVW
jgi:hypothetical protein